MIDGLWMRSPISSPAFDPFWMVNPVGESPSLNTVGEQEWTLTRTSYFMLMSGNKFDDSSKGLPLR